jgi:hypothetical protein
MGSSFTERPWYLLCEMANDVQAILDPSPSIFSICAMYSARLDKLRPYVDTWCSHCAVRLSKSYLPFNCNDPVSTDGGSLPPFIGSYTKTCVVNLFFSQLTI